MNKKFKSAKIVLFVVIILILIFSIYNFCVYSKSKIEEINSEITSYKESLQRYPSKINNLIENNDYIVIMYTDMVKKIQNAEIHNLLRINLQFHDFRDYINDDLLLRKVDRSLERSMGTRRYKKDELLSLIIEKYKEAYIKMGELKIDYNNEFIYYQSRYNEILLHFHKRKNYAYRLLLPLEFLNIKINENEINEIKILLDEFLDNIQKLNNINIGEIQVPIDDNKYKDILEKYNTIYKFDDQVFENLKHYDLIE
jgi:hypothetical protein